MGNCSYFSELYTVREIFVCHWHFTGVKYDIYIQVKEYIFTQKIPDPLKYKTMAFNWLEM